jgi:hypothetical protein
MHEISRRAREAVARAPIQRIHLLSTEHRAATLARMQKREN